jgi:hypothetical protein
VIAAFCDELISGDTPADYELTRQFDPIENPTKGFAFLPVADAFLSVLQERTEKEFGATKRFISQRRISGANNS